MSGDGDAGDMPATGSEKGTGVERRLRKGTWSPSRYFEEYLEPLRKGVARSFKNEPVAVQVVVFNKTVRPINFLDEPWPPKLTREYWVYAATIIKLVRQKMAEEFKDEVASGAVSPADVGVWVAAYVDATLKPMYYWVEGSREPDA